LKLHRTGTFTIKVGHSESDNYSDQQERTLNY